MQRQRTALQHTGLDTHIILHNISSYSYSSRIQKTTIETPRDTGTHIPVHRHRHPHPLTQPYIDTDQNTNTHTLPYTTQTMHDHMYVYTYTDRTQQLSKIAN